MPADTPPPAGEATPQGRLAAAPTGAKPSDAEASRPALEGATNSCPRCGINAYTGPTLWGCPCCGASALVWKPRRGIACLRRIGLATRATTDLLARFIVPPTLKGK